MYLIEVIDKKNTRLGRDFFSTYEKAREKYDELTHDEYWGIVRMWDGNGNQLFLHIDYRGIDKSMFNGNDKDF